MSCIKNGLQIYYKINYYSFAMAMDLESQKLVQSVNKIATSGGRYRYTSVLGRGGFGVVIRGTNHYTNQEVAIKILQSAKRSFFLRRKQSKTVKQGQKEADLLLDLKHDHIIAVLDTFEFRHRLKSHFAIVMDYCSGGSLQERLETIVHQSYGKLTDEQILDWYHQLASALEYIHSKGIAHRDIKPLNILVDGADNLKVADVGIAKRMHEESAECDSSFQVYMKTMGGTLVYMAPEVHSGHYSERIDVFSMGLVMYVIRELPINYNELIPLVQCREFEVNPLGSTFYSNMKATEISATSLLNAQNVQPDEKLLFDDMLHYDHSKRPTAAEVVRKIEHIREERRTRRVRKGRQEAERERRQQQDDSWCIIL